MFTGIVEELGTVRSVTPMAGGVRMTFEAAAVTEGTSPGDSIAVNGVCLTALDLTDSSFSAELSQETLDRSTLGRIEVGTRVNLERAVMPSTRLGGHFVQGHVDGRGTFVGTEDAGDFFTVRIGFPAELARYFVHKGSVSVEGISLTIADLRDDSFDIAVIPKTWELTNLATLKPGDSVNLEVDVIAKYVERLMAEKGSPTSTLTRQTLNEAGFA